MSIIHAKISSVKIGSLTIQGLLFSDGSFGVAIPQLVEQGLISVNGHKKYATQTIERLLGEPFNGHKVKVESYKNLINALTLVQFEKIMLKLDRAGDVKAQAFRDALVGLSLVQLFHDAFGLEFAAIDRQNWLKARMESKALFWELTDSIKQYHLSRGVEPKFYHYSNAMDAINRGLFGKTAKEIRAELGVTEGLTRDNFGDKALRWLTTVQETAARYVNEGKEPQQAVTEVMTLLRYERIPYNV